MPTRAIAGCIPHEGRGCWVAPETSVLGAVTIGPDASVWYGSVLRADRDCIVVGSGSNVQDGCVLHADPGFPVTVGCHVSVGHRAVLHGCTVQDEVLIGMGAIILNGAIIHSGSVIGAGTVIPEGTVVPPDSLVVGVPGRVRRSTTQAERDDIVANAELYVRLKAEHADAKEKED